MTGADVQVRRVLEVKKGVIFENGKMLGCSEADLIADRNDLIWAERFVEKFDDQRVSLDARDKVVRAVPL